MLGLPVHSQGPALDDRGGLEVRWNQLREARLHDASIQAKHHRSGGLGSSRCHTDHRVAGEHRLPPSQRP